MIDTKQIYDLRHGRSRLGEHLHRIDLARKEKDLDDIVNRWHVLLINPFLRHKALVTFLSSRLNFNFGYRRLEKDHTNAYLRPNLSNFWVIK